MTYYLAKASFKPWPFFFHFLSSYVINLLTTFSKHVITQGVTLGWVFKPLPLLPWSTVLGVHQQPNSCQDPAMVVWHPNLVHSRSYKLLSVAIPQDLGTDLLPPIC